MATSDEQIEKLMDNLRSLEESQKIGEKSIEALQKAMNELKKVNKPVDENAVDQIEKELLERMNELKASLEGVKFKLEETTKIIDSLKRNIKENEDKDQAEKRRLEVKTLIIEEKLSDAAKKAESMSESDLEEILNSITSAVEVLLKFLSEIKKANVEQNKAKYLTGLKRLFYKLKANNVHKSYETRHLYFNLIYLISRESALTFLTDNHVENHLISLCAHLTKKDRLGVVDFDDCYNMQFYSDHSYLSYDGFQLVLLKSSGEDNIWKVSFNEDNLSWEFYSEKFHPSISDGGYIAASKSRDSSGYFLQPSHEPSGLHLVPLLNGEGFYLRCSDIMEFLYDPFVLHRGEKHSIQTRSSPSANNDDQLKFKFVLKG